MSCLRCLILTSHGLHMQESYSVVSTIKFWLRHTIYTRERHKQSCGNIDTGKSIRTGDVYRFWL